MNLQARLNAALRALALPLGAAFGALAVGAVILQLLGISPLTAFAALWDGAFGAPHALGMTLTRTTPLLLIGLGIAFALRAGLLNLGGEGQLHVGALFGTVAALYLPPLPAWLMLPLCLAAAFLGGALWGGLAGWMKVRWQMNEIITTIVLNYVGFWFVSLLVHGPLKDPQSYGYPWTVMVPAAARLPLFGGPARINLGILVGVVAAVVMHLILWRTVAGFQVRATGSNATTAEFAGIPVGRRILLSMVLAGGLAGLGGVAEILGVQHRLSDFFSPGYGYDAIAVALLGQSNPLGVVAAALFFGALRTGAESIQRSINAPAAVALVIQGVAVLFTVIGGSPILIRLMARRGASVGGGRE